MPWIPTETLLGTLVENQSFGYGIQYYTETVGAGSTDPGTGESVPGEVTQTYYPVQIVPGVVKPTIGTTIGNPANISGYFQKVFNDTIQYRDNNGNIVTLNGDATTGAWDKLDINAVSEMTSFRPDTNRDITFSYTANALDGNTVIASQVYTIRIFDPSWSGGQANLKNAVNITVARG